MSGARYGPRQKRTQIRRQPSDHTVAISRFSRERNQYVRADRGRQSRLSHERERDRANGARESERESHSPRNKRGQNAEWIEQRRDEDDDDIAAGTENKKEINCRPPASARASKKKESETAPSSLLMKEIPRFRALRKRSIERENAVHLLRDCCVVRA